jgi:hypothetical protein
MHFAVVIRVVQRPSPQSGQETIDAQTSTIKKILEKSSLHACLEKTSLTTIKRMD